METMTTQPTVKGPDQWFTGDVWIDAITRGVDPSSKAAVNAVRFAPGARTAWHSHSTGQTLYVTDGAGLVQPRDGEALAIRAGDVVHAPAGEWHWHGADADHFMTHLSITDGDASWGDHVTDDEYQGSGR